MRSLPDGRKYWTTADDFDGQRGDPVPYLARHQFTRPNFRSNGQLSRPDLKTNTVASEAWTEMKNGFIAYYIWGNSAQRRGRAELFVEDPDNIKIQYNYAYLETGRSCITCHAQGVQAAPSDVATAVENGTFRGGNLDVIKRHWTSNDKLRDVYGETRVKFHASMKKLVEGLSDGDASVNKALVNGAGQEPTLLLLKIIDRLR